MNFLIMCLKFVLVAHGENSNIAVCKGLGHSDGAPTEFVPLFSLTSDCFDFVPLFIHACIHFLDIRHVLTFQWQRYVNTC